MAKKKQQNLLHDPPTASSSDDDDIEHSEEDSSSDEEAIKTLPKVPSASDGKAASDSDSGSDAETESDDSDSEATNLYKSGKTVPVAASSVALPPAKSGTKRPASEGTPAKEDNSTKRAKRKVITSGEEGGSVKSPAFQRKWTEEDEISLLGGMIDFKADTGKSPYDDTNGFYESVKKSFSFEVSKNQFMEKIRSLKKKFFGNEVKNGAKSSFAKAHDLNIYKLSKQIWGADGIALVSNIKSTDVSKKSQSKKKLDMKQELVSVASPNGKMSDASPNGKKVEDDGKVEIHRRSLGKSDWFAESSLVRSIAAYGVDENFVKQKWTLVSIEEKKKIEEKWKQLQAKEFQFVLEKTDFVHAVTTMIVEASKNKPSDI